MLLVGSVPPYLTNYAYFNASVHTVSTTRCNDIRIPKVNLEVANESLQSTGAMEFNGLPCFIKSKKSLTKFSKETKDFFPN